MPLSFWQNVANFNQLSRHTLDTLCAGARFIHAQLIAQQIVFNFFSIINWLIYYKNKNKNTNRESPLTFLFTPRPLHLPVYNVSLLTRHLLIVTSSIIVHQSPRAVDTQMHRLVKCQMLHFRCEQAPLCPLIDRETKLSNSLQLIIHSGKTPVTRFLLQHFRYLGRGVVYIRHLFGPRVTSASQGKK